MVSAAKSNKPVAVEEIYKNSGQGWATGDVVSEVLLNSQLEKGKGTYTTHSLLPGIPSWQSGYMNLVLQTQIDQIHEIAYVRDYL